LEVVVVNGDGDTLGIANNFDTYQTIGGKYVEVCWNDKNVTEDEYKMLFNIWLPTTDGFKWIEMAGVPFQDGGTGLNLGDDGILDFVLGDCECEPADYNWTQGNGCQPLDPYMEDSAYFYALKVTADSSLHWYNSYQTVYSHWYNPPQTEMNAIYWVYHVYNGVVVQEEWSYGARPYTMSGHPEPDTANTGEAGYFHYYAKNTCDINKFWFQLSEIKLPTCISANGYGGIHYEPEWSIILTGDQKVQKDVNGVTRVVWAANEQQADTITGFQYNWFYEW
jgi:hypothetical protein